MQSKFVDSAIASVPADGIPAKVGNNHFMEDREIDVLDGESLEKIRAYVKHNLKGLVFRRVSQVYLETNAKVTHRYFFPPTENDLASRTRDLRPDEVAELEPEELYARVETRCSGQYSFGTAKQSVYPAEDVFVGQRIFGLAKNRCELDPVTLSLVPIRSANVAMPRAMKGIPHKSEDPASLVCGLVRLNRQSNRLEFFKWFMATEQLVRAVLMLTHPSIELPVNSQGHIRSGPVAQAFWMGGNRLVTNTYRKMFLSEVSSGGSVEPKFKETKFAIHVGERMSRTCHSLAFWVMLVKYGQISGDNNIPTTVAEKRANDPVKRANQYIPKPMKCWDLYFVKVGSEMRSLKEVVLSTFELTFTKKVVAYPVNKDSLIPIDFNDFTVEEMEEFSGLESVVSAAEVKEVAEGTETKAESEPDSDLSQDSGSDSEETAKAEVQVFTWPTYGEEWGARAEKETSMDFTENVETSWWNPVGKIINYFK